jgi:IS605 OrfB family transposase
MQSFFRLLILKKSGKYSDSINLPHYKKQEQVMTCPIQGRSCRIQKNGTVAIGLTKEFREKYNISERRILFTIPKNIRHITQFQEIRIIPLYNGKEFSVEFIYQDNTVKPQSNGNGYMSIDLGVSNFAACTIFSNGDACQFLIDGRRLTNINHYYNKSISKLKSDYSKNKSLDSIYTNRMIRLINGRNNRITDYFNRVCHILVNTCIDHGVTTLVIGYNKGQKQDINLGAVNNQKIVSIPYHKFRQKLEQLCIEHGISYISQEESYTSKASALDMDAIPTYGVDESPTAFNGKRIHRGLYRSSDGSVLNADINGSINILRKYVKERNENWIYQDSVRALVNVPCQRVSPFAQAPSFRLV